MEVQTIAGWEMEEENAEGTEEERQEVMENEEAKHTHIVVTEPAPERCGDGVTSGNYNKHETHNSCTQAKLGT